MRILRNEKELIVFEVEHISVLNDGFLDRLSWPEGVSKAAFRFENPIESAPGQVLKHLSARHYPRIGYYARPEDLISPVAIDPDSPIKRSSSEDLDALKSLTRSTLTTFLNQWRGLARPDISQQLDEYLEKQMTLAGTVLMEKQGAPAALINLLEIQDCLGVSVEHIGWAWIDPRLGLGERRQVRAIAVDRLKQSRARSLHAFVDYFNFRSLNSIVNIGFKPTCVHISRSASFPPAHH